MKRILADAARPEFVDQHPQSVRVRCGFVDPLDCDSCHVLSVISIYGFGQEIYLFFRMRPFSVANGLNLRFPAFPKGPYAGERSPSSPGRLFRKRRCR